MPVLERDEARALFDSIASDDVVSLRDKALFSMVLFGFVRVGAGRQDARLQFRGRGSPDTIWSR